MRWSDRVGRHVLSNLLEATGTDLHSSISINPKHIVKVIQQNRQETYNSDQFVQHGADKVEWGLDCENSVGERKGRRRTKHGTGRG